MSSSKSNLHLPPLHDTQTMARLREFEFGTTYSAGERRHSRGVATAPGDGGRAVVYPRTPVVHAPVIAEQVSA